jgi:hypothetical protein
VITAAAPAATTAARAAAPGETFSPETRLTMALLSAPDIDQFRLAALRRFDEPLEPDELERERPDEPLPDALLRDPLDVLLPLLFEERDPLAVLLPLLAPRDEPDFELAFAEPDFDEPDLEEPDREERERDEPDFDEPDRDAVRDEPDADAAAVRVRERRPLSCSSSWSSSWSSSSSSSSSEPCSP